jgi:predicted nucleic acid-binding protein
MILADTSVLIDLLRGEIKAKQLEEYGEIATCFPIQCELYKGTKIARNTEEGEKQVKKLLERLKGLEAGPKAAKKFSELRQKYSDINDFDLMIAGICIANNADILTQDSDFEKIEELKSLNP